MAMTRKQVKEFVEDLNNWRIIPGNEYIQLAVLDFGGLHYANIMERRDRSIYRYLTAQENTPDIQWCWGTYHIYDPENGVLVYSTSKSQIENKIYEVQKA